MRFQHLIPPSCTLGYRKQVSIDAESGCFREGLRTLSLSFTAEYLVLFGRPPAEGTRHIQGL